LALFLPTVAVEKVTDITPELIYRMGGSALLLDVDNTLALHGSQIPFPGTIEWAGRIRAAGIQVIIMSNNFEKRVAPFAARYGLPFLSLSVKPFPLAYLRAIHRLGVKRSQAVTVGDQIFTDVFGANLARVKSILLNPVEEESSFSFVVRRALERPIRRKIEKSGLGKKFLSK